MDIQNSQDAEVGAGVDDDAFPCPSDVSASGGFNISTCCGDRVAKSSGSGALLEHLQDKVFG